MKNLIEEIHKIKIDGRNIKYYLNKGIICKAGDIIKINSSELNPGSRINVRCICNICNKECIVPFNRYNRCKLGFICSGKCRMIRTNKSLKIKFGVDNTFQLDSTKLKKIKTFNIKYGVNNPSQSGIIKERKRKTCMKNYGVDNPFQSDVIKERKKKTCRKNYGVDYPIQSDIIRNKCIETLQDKYGKHITNISQIPEVMDKKICTGIRTKNYILPSGKIVRIQGYENFGIEYLLNIGIKECDLFIGNKIIENEIGRFYFYNTFKKKSCRYFPDIYVKSQNKIYEVKSNYTMALHPELIYKKRQSVIDLGFNFEFLVFNSKGMISYNI
jgi:hypothetical protein